MAPTITYRGQGQAMYRGRDTGVPEIFRVSEDGYDIAFVAVASGTLHTMLQQRGVEQSALIRRAGLAELERQLVSDELPRENDEGYVEKMYSSNDFDDLVALRGSAKECAWQERTNRGLECDATQLGQERATTQATCAACALTDERLICAHLSHPRNVPVRAMGSFERVAGPALCELGNDAADGADCRPGGKVCWQRIVEPMQPVGVAAPAAAAQPAADAELARAAIGEIDHFREAYRRVYGVEVWQIDQARSIAELSGAAATEEAFHRKVQVLTLLLSSLRPEGQLDENRRLGSDGQPVRGLVALERLMEQDAPAALPAAETLRHIAALRNDYPTHLRGRNVAAARAALGVDWPPADWDAAWRTILARFQESLRQIREALAP